MRTIDIARRAGCSIQQVGKLEAAGVLPPASRTAAGYREWDDTHLAGVLAYRQLTLGHWAVEARLLVAEARRDGHAHPTRRRTRPPAPGTPRDRADPVRGGVHPRRTSPRHRPADSMSVGELAIAPGARPSTLRHWEAERLLSPARSSNGARTYSPVDVRDAPLIHQLRQAGHRINPLRDLLPTLQTGDAWAEVLRRTRTTAAPDPVRC